MKVAVIETILLEKFWKRFIYLSILLSDVIFSKTVLVWGLFIRHWRDPMLSTHSTQYYLNFGNLHTNQFTPSALFRHGYSKITRGRPQGGPAQARWTRKLLALEKQPLHGPPLRLPLLVEVGQ